MEYYVVASHSLYKIIELVQDLIDLGWEPLGGIAARDAGFYQAMIKK
jgi:hypothetical protein